MRQTNIQLGLKENWKQFILLLIVNAFVGGMVGLERTILPQLAEEEFLVVVTSAVLSFIIVFGVVKAITIYFNVCPTLELDYNLNDGMIWGILPIILANRGFNLKNIAIIVAVYRILLQQIKHSRGLRGIFFKISLLHTTSLS